MADLEAYIDESGAVDGRSPFMVGVWFTAYPGLWRRVIEECRDEERFGYSFHFNEISRRPDDWQFRVVLEVFKRLRWARHRWYGRILHVPAGAGLQRVLSPQDLYDTAISMAILGFTARMKTKRLKVVLSNRSRVAGDFFIPDGLERLLRRRTRGFRGPSISVEVRDHREDDLVQLADLVVSSVWQAYYPSENVNKQKLAAMMREAMGTRLWVWDWSSIAIASEKSRQRPAVDAAP